MEQFSYIGTRIADDVRGKFGDDAGVQISNADLIRWINDGARRIATENPFLQRARKTNLIAGVTLYNLNQLLNSERVMKFGMVTAGGQKLEFLSFDDFQQRVGAGGPGGGAPTIATEFSGELSIWPAPAESGPGQLVIYFWAYPQDIVTLEELLPVPDRFVDALAAYVLAQAHELDDQLESAAAKKGDFDELQRRARAQELNLTPDQFYPTSTYIPDYTFDDGSY